jgi:HEAT repeat protein
VSEPVADSAERQSMRDSLREALAGEDGTVAAERVMGAAMGENSWDRDRWLEAARGITDASPLLPTLENGLRDGRDAERRNAARAVYASLADPAAADSDTALDSLIRLATTDTDPDVRLLAATALGESHNPGARPALERVLADPNSNVAATAADALGELGDHRAVDRLAKATAAGDAWVRIAAVVSLGRLGDPRALPALARAVEDPVIAEAAAAALGAIGDAAGLPLLEPLLHQTAPTRETAVEAASLILAANPGLAPSQRLRAALRERVPVLRNRLVRTGDEGAALLLGTAGTPEAATTLVAALSGPHAAAAAAGLSRLPPALARSALLGALPELGPEGRAWALSALPPLGDPAAIEQLLPYLAAPEEEVRVAAAECLARSDEERVLPGLLQSLGTPSMRRGAVRALALMGGARCAPLADLLDDPDPVVRRGAAEGLARCATPEIQERIVRAVRTEQHAEARLALLEALGTAAGDEAVALLEPLRHDAPPGLRFALVRAFGHTRSPAAVPPLLDALVDPVPEIRTAALQALGEVGDTQGARPVAEFLDSADSDVRLAAATALRDISSTEILDRLVAALADPSWAVRHAAARARGRLRAREAEEPLRQLAERDPDTLVRRAAEAALAALGEGPASGGSG